MIFIFHPDWRVFKFITEASTQAEHFPPLVHRNCNDSPSIRREMPLSRCKVDHGTVSQSFLTELLLCYTKARLRKCHCYFVDLEILDYRSFSYTRLFNLTKMSLLGTFSTSAECPQHGMIFFVNAETYNLVNTNHPFRASPTKRPTYVYAKLEKNRSRSTP